MQVEVKTRRQVGVTQCPSISDNPNLWSVRWWSVFSLSFTGQEAD